MGPSLVGLPRYLLDTNVLVYAHDGRDPDKQLRAKELLLHLGSRATAAIPAQALAEFASVALRKLQPAIPGELLYKQLEALERAFPILALTPAVVLEAVRAVRDHQLAYYDAQVWAVAKLAQVPFLLSEDFASGAVLEGVNFVNPFASDFVVATL